MPPKPLNPNSEIYTPVLLSSSPPDVSQVVITAKNFNGITTHISPSRRKFLASRNSPSQVSTPDQIMLTPQEIEELVSKLVDIRVQKIQNEMDSRSLRLDSHMNTLFSSWYVSLFKSLAQQNKKLDDYRASIDCINGNLDEVVLVVRDMRREIKHLRNAVAILMRDTQYPHF